MLHGLGHSDETKNRLAGAESAGQEMQSYFIKYCDEAFTLPVMKYSKYELVLLHLLVKFEIIRLCHLLIDLNRQLFDRTLRYIFHLVSDQPPYPVLDHT